MESKYLLFEEVRDTGKTKVFEVVNKRGGLLGQVHWYGPWRRYVFAPTTEAYTLFDYSCMSDICQFIKELMDARANKLIELIKRS